MFTPIYLQLPAVVVNILIFLEIHGKEGLVQDYVTDSGEGAFLHGYWINIFL